MDLDQGVGALAVGLDVAPSVVDEGFDPQRQAPRVEQACQLQGTVKPLQALHQALIALRAPGGVKDVLSPHREGLDDVIEVTRASGVQFEAVSRMPATDRSIIKALIEGMIVKNETRRVLDSAGR